MNVRSVRDYIEMLADRERIRAVGQTVVIEDSSPHAAPPLAAVMMVSLAVQNERSVCIRYRSAREEVTERAFNPPYGVVSHEGFWYTIGYCHLRQGQRLLRLDRILRVEITDERFLRPANFEALAAVQRALASVPRACQVEVWLKATLEEAQRKTPLSKGHFKEQNNGVLISSEVEDLPWMARLLAGLGIPFIIHSPPELRIVFRQYALVMMSYAEQTEETS